MKLAAVLAVVGAALTALLVQYFVLIRPWYQTWGASSAELREPLPGDELALDAREVETRAITIDAPPERVWPWLAQLGQDRAGFYSYGLLQNVAGMDMPRGERLLGLPDPRPGEKLLMSPRPAMGGRAFAVYERVEPGRALVLRTYALRMMGAGGAPPPTGSWTFALSPEPDGRTRLLVRSRRGSAHVAPTLAASALGALVLDPLHFMFERRLMLGVKDRAEARPLEPAWVEAGEVALWLSTALLGLAGASAMCLRRPADGRSLLAATAALFVFTLLFFARPPLALALGLVVALRFVVAWAWKRPAAERRAAAPA